MTITTTIQAIGDNINAVPEVEAATKAVRAILYPADYVGISGGMNVAAISINLNNASGAIAFNGPVFSFRWTSKVTVARVKSVLITAGGIGSGSGTWTYQLFRASQFQRQYGGSNATLSATGLPPTLVPIRLRANAGLTGTPLQGGIDDAGKLNTVGDIVYEGAPSAAGTLGMTGATVTLDTNPIASVTSSGPSVAGKPIGVPFRLWDTAFGDQSLILTNLEGLVVNLITGGTQGVTANSQLLGISVNFEELPLANHEEFQ